MNRNNFKILMILSAFAVIAAAGSTMAFLTGTDTSTNTFVVGDVVIDLLEPAWESPKKMMPGESFPKDPYLKNTGTNPLYAFIEVKIPKKVIYTYDPITKARIPPDEINASTPGTALFQINRESSAAFTNTNTVTSRWIKVSEDKTDPDWDTYVFAYGSDSELTKLSHGAKTTELFNSVTYCYAVEGQDLDKENIAIIVNAYGIQADNITGDGISSPARVWTILNNQAIR